MRYITFIAVLVAAVASLGAARAAEDKAKSWCTDTHMQKMDEMIAAMTDAEKQKEAQDQLALSKAAMQEGKMEGCVEHMEAAHKAMGM